MSGNSLLLVRDGFTAGRAWADCCAKPEQLQRLAIFRQQLDSSRSLDWNRFFSEERCCVYSKAELVAFEILGTERLISRSDASAFWEGVLGAQAKKVEQNPFVRGFAEGAIAHME